MNVFFIDQVHPVLKEELQKKGMTCTDGTSLNKQEVIEALPEIDGIVIRSKFIVNEEILNAAARLKFVARSGSGLENINVELAEKKGIKVFNSPEGNCTAVAEHAIGMILNLFNTINKGDCEVRQKIWDRDANNGIELSGKTVGIIGYGHTGSGFAKRLSGFDVTILACDKYKKDFSDAYCKESTLSEIQEKADIISFHVPLTEETHYMFNSEFISSVQKPFYLINTSRGKVVKTADLVEGLKSKKITGAVLDVLEYEKHNFEETGDFPAEFDYLAQSKNTILTPHVAGKTRESYYKLSKVLADKIIAEFCS